jgi:NTE family protein
MKAGVALSGGFVKGLAHAGFLKALESRNVKPSFVAGSSAGALVGFLYCAGYSPEEIKNLARSVTWRKLLKPSFKGGFFSLSGLKKELLELVGDVEFDALPVGMGVAVVNLETLEVEFVTEGKALDWVLASCSIPPVFSPWKTERGYYMDGAVRNSLPVEILERAGCSVKLCSTVNTPLYGRRLDSLIDNLSRLFLAGAVENEEKRRHRCNLLVVHHLEGSMFDLSKVEYYYQKGFENTLKVLDGGFNE